MPEIVGRMPSAGKAKLLDQVGDDDGVGISKGDAQRFNFCNVSNVVTFLRNVLRED
jgi:hypothetical protein